MGNRHTTTLPGVLLSLDNCGVLLRGPSGSGKSELALSLLDRGHQLIADDSVHIIRQQEKLIGYAVNSLASGFIETRNLGVLNAAKLFGEHAVAESAVLALIVELQHNNETHDRLTGDYHTTSLLGITVNQIFLPPSPSRRLDLLVEIALRQCQLRSETNYDSRQHFCQQQQLMMTEQYKDEVHDHLE